MAREVIVKAENIKKRSVLSRIIKITLLIILLLLCALYFTLGLVYREGAFTVTLGEGQDESSGLVVFDDITSARGKRRLDALPVNDMDNISYKWLPANVDTEADGSHNGDNYLAYSFYVENQGEKEFNYFYELVVDSVVKDVDDAIRIRIYENGVDTTYAKAAKDGNPEPLTEKFLLDPKRPIKGQSIVVKKRENFSPNETDRYTVVIWIEGDDPECLDNLIGGAIKMHMIITEEPNE